MEKEKKIKTEVHNVTEVEVEAQQNAIQRVPFEPVDKLEEAAKVGFYCERKLDDSLLEPLVRLCCEDKDPDKQDLILTPWCAVSVLGAMIQGCLYLNPLILRCIKENQKNAPTPEN